MRKAHEEFISKRKLRLILRSETTQDISTATGDLIQIFLKNDKKKRSKLSETNPVLSYDHKSITIAVPGKYGRTINAVIRDVRPAIIENVLTIAIKESIEDCYSNLDDVLDLLETAQHHFDAVLNETEAHVFSLSLRDDENDSPLILLPTVENEIYVYWSDDGK